MIIDQLSFGVRWAGGWLLPAKPEGAKEFVRHKILDLLGDLALLGRLILGWVVAYRPGHAFNLQFLTGVERRCDGDR
jgi:UDP-3-O-acyl-N-acetylglucosamine deacetylase